MDNETLEIEIKDKKQFYQIIKEEGDYFEFINPYSRYPCCINRNYLTKAWCGYVAIPEDHPFYGKHFKDIDMTLQPMEKRKIKVHGGLTFSDKGMFGFDCGHPTDYYIDDNFTPLMSAINMISDIGEMFFDNVKVTGKVTYKTKEFVIRETHKMAEAFFEYRNYKKID